jgi:hypothetical protein
LINVDWLHHMTIPFLRVNNINFNHQHFHTRELNNDSGSNHHCHRFNHGNGTKQQQHHQQARNASDRLRRVSSLGLLKFYSLDSDTGSNHHYRDHRLKNNNGTNSNNNNGLETRLTRRGPQVFIFIFLLTKLTTIYKFTMRIRNGTPSLSIKRNWKASHDDESRLSASQVVNFKFLTVVFLNLLF